MLNLLRFRRRSELHLLDMDKVREFQKRARECRDLAAATGAKTVRDQYAELAEMWDRLARERLQFFVVPGE